jgi:hypothetical protein
VAVVRIAAIRYRGRPHNSHNGHNSHSSHNSHNKRMSHNSPGTGTARCRCHAYDSCQRRVRAVVSVIKTGRTAAGAPLASHRGRVVSGIGCGGRDRVGAKARAGNPNGCGLGCLPTGRCGPLCVGEGGSVDDARSAERDRAPAHRAPAHRTSPWLLQKSTRSARARPLTERLVAGSDRAFGGLSKSHDSPSAAAH